MVAFVYLNQTVGVGLVVRSRNALHTYSLNVHRTIYFNVMTYFIQVKVENVHIASNLDAKRSNIDPISVWYKRSVSYV